MAKNKVVVIDYGSGNLHSVFNACNKVTEEMSGNISVKISNQISDLEDATHIILPGVGTFDDCINNLGHTGLVPVLKKEILEKKKLFLGVCVGMQILADLGFENGQHEGLGFIPGKVMKIDDQDSSLPVPHVGWNNVAIKQSHPILKDIDDNEHFYFVHSYHFEVCDWENILAVTNYGGEISAIVGRDNIIATQFHPEKSSKAGLQILKNFISWQHSTTIL